MSFSFYDRVQTGQLISRGNSDIRSVQMFLAFAPTIVIQFVTFFFALAFMVTINPLLTLVALAPMPFVFLARRQDAEAHVPDLVDRAGSRMAEVATIVEENITGVRIVKSFAAELHQIRELAERGAARAVGERQAGGHPRALLAADREPAAARAGDRPALRRLARVAGQLDVGAILLFMGYIVLAHRAVPDPRLHADAERSAPAHRRSASTRSSTRRRTSRTGRAPSTSSSRAATSSSTTSRSRYATGPTSWTTSRSQLHRGETVALVGRTGCGKSTVARLLMRFYDVTRRRGAVDGRDVRDLTLESLRSHIGIVSDDPFLFSDSIRDNIAYGRPDAPLDDVVAAAKAAGAHDFIDGCPRATTS